MQMYPGANYKEQHHYKVEKDDYMYKDDFQFSKGGSSPSMHMKRHDQQYATADHHRHHGKLGPTMHMMMKPDDHNKHHNYGGYCGPNKQGMSNYSETIYEQEEMKHFHGNNKYDNNNFSGHHNYGKPYHGGREGGGYADHHNYGMSSYGGNEHYYSDGRKMGAAAMWDCKGIDD